MTFKSIGVLLLWSGAQVSMAQCIEVEGRDFALSTNDIGSAVVRWEAQLNNRCRKTLDADLTIELLDGNAQPVYELLDKTTLEVEENRQVEKEVYVPSRIVDQVKGISIRVEERERQY